MKRKILSFVLCITLIFNLFPVISADNQGSDNIVTEEQVNQVIATGDSITISPISTQTNNKEDLTAYELICEAEGIEVKNQEELTRLKDLLKRYVKLNEISEKDIDAICIYFEIDKQILQELGKENYSLKEMVDIAYLAKRYPSFNLDEIKTLYRNSKNIKQTHKSITVFEWFSKLGFTTDENIRKTRKLMFVGFDIERLIKAHIASQALGIDFEMSVSKENYQVDSLEKEMVGDEKENESYKAILLSYFLDKHGLQNYKKASGLSWEEILAKIINYEAYTYSKVAESSIMMLGGGESTTTPEVDFTNHFKVPFYYKNSINEYISPSNGALCFRKDIVNLAGRNGHDLNLKIKYNNTTSQLFKGTDPVTEQDKYNGITAGWTYDLPYIIMPKRDEDYTLCLGDGETKSFYDDYAHTYSFRISDWSVPQMQDMKIVADGSITNGFENSCFVLQYKDGKKDYFGVTTGRLIASIDRYGNKITYSYVLIDGYYKVSKITDSLNHDIVFDYINTETGREIKITAPGNKTTRLILSKILNYPNEYLLTSIIDPDNNPINLDYNIDVQLVEYIGLYPPSPNVNICANLKQVTYPTNAVSTYTYKKEYERYGDYTRTEYYKIDTREDIVDGNICNKLNYQYDHGFTGFCCRLSTGYTDRHEYWVNITDGNNTRRELKFNAKNLNTNEKVYKNGTTLVSETINEYQYNKLLSKATTTKYNELGASLTKQTISNYDIYGDLISYTDENNHITQYSYDPKFHILTNETKDIDESTKQITEYQVNQTNGNIDSVTEHNYENGVFKPIVTYYDYDTYGNTISERTVKKDGTSLVKNYDYGTQYNSGYLTKTNITVKDYKGISHEVNENYVYDFNTGNLTEYKNGNDHSTKYEYDKLNRLTKLTNPDLTYKTLDYDDISNIVTSTDEIGYKQRNVYDGLGRQTKTQEYKDGVWVTLEEKHYDNLSQVDWSKDAKGNLTSYEYDKQGRVTKVTNPDLTYNNTTYDDAVPSKTEINEDGDYHSYSYDLKGNLVKEESIQDKNRPDIKNVKQYKYNYLDKLTEGIDANGNTIKYGYDNLLRLTSVTNNLNEPTKYEYDNLNNLTKITTVGNSVTQRIYDDLGRLITAIDPVTRAEYYLYDNAGNIVEKKDKNSQLTTFQYNNREKLKTQIAGPITISYNYDDTGKIKTVSNNTGTIVYDYYPNGKLKIEKNQEDNKQVMYTYDINGNRETMTDQFGKITSYTFDNRNRLKTVALDGGAPTQYNYHNDGSRESIVYPGGTKEVYTYDGVNNLLTLTNKRNDNSIINSYTYTYDKAGNQLTKKDADGLTSYNYDSLNRVKDVNEPGSKTTSYTYDNNGNIATKTVINGTSAADILGLWKSAGYPSSRIAGRTVSGDFNGDGKKDIASFCTYANNEVRTHVWISNGTSYSYQGSTGWWSKSPYLADAITDKLVCGDYDGDGKDDIAAMYPGVGNESIIHVWKSTGTSFEFQADSGWWKSTGYTSDVIKGRIVSGDFNGDNKDDIAAFYYNSSNETRLNVWLSTGTSFTYQGSTGWWNSTTYIAGKINDKIVAQDFNGDGKDDIAAFYGFTSNETSIHVWLSSGTSFNYQGENGWWRVTGYTSDAIANKVVSDDFDGDGYNDIAAIYDYGNNKTRIHVWKSNGQAFVYQSSLGWWQGNHYSASNINNMVMAGDIDGDGKGDITAFYDYGNSELRIHAWKPTGSAFIPQNVYSQTTTYKYDLSNRLDSTIATGLAGNMITLFNYDNNGNLLSKSKSTGESYSYVFNIANQMTSSTNTSGVATTYAYNPNGVRKSKTIGGNTTAYYYDGNNVIIETLNGAFSARNIRGINLIAREINTGDKMYYLYNGHGDVMNLVDEAGNIKNTYDYDIYGKEKKAVENGTTNPIRYAGEYYDSESDMYYLRARYYDPEIARFISEDTNKGKIEDPLSLNLYTYCNNNPIIYTDPNGHFPVPAILAYFALVANSPDTQMDMQMVALDISEGNYFAAVLDAAGTLVPGATGVGKMGDEAVKAVKTTKILENATKGRAFEKAGLKLMGFTKNTEKIGGRIADVLIKNEKGAISAIVEFKNCKYLSKSDQLTTFIRQAGSNFTLVVNEYAELSKPLIEQIQDAGGHIYRMVDGELIPEL